MNLPCRDDLPPGTLSSDISPAELERDGGDRERELDERLWREEDARFWRRWFIRHGLEEL